MVSDDVVLPVCQEAHACGCVVVASGVVCIVGCFVACVRLPCYSVATHRCHCDLQQAEEDAERIAFLQIDWHDFVVVETVEFKDDDVMVAPGQLQQQLAAVPQAVPVADAADGEALWLSALNRTVMLRRSLSVCRGRR